MYLKRFVEPSQLAIKELTFTVARRSVVGVAIIFGLMSCPSSARAQNLVADPTYLTLEQPGSPWSLNNGGPGTITSGPLAGDNYFQSGCISDCFDPVNGSFTSQVITIPIAGDYDFSLLVDSDIGESPARTPNAVLVNLFPVGTPPADQTTILSVQDNTTGGWVPENTEFDLSSAGQYELQIFGEQVPGIEGITDPDLEQAPANTPEPDSALLLTAAGALLLVVRRRKGCGLQSAGVDQAS